MHMIAGVLQYVAVASFAEAWIEKRDKLRRLLNVDQSPPSRRRGLKTTGVDILQQMLMSPPSRRRGLKTIIINRCKPRGYLSPPSRRRGLKIVTIKEVVDWIEVASFAEAWIEKIYTCHKTGKKWSPPSRRRGLKKQISLKFVSFLRSPPSRRRGLKNQHSFQIY